MESPAQKMNAPLAGGRMHRALTIALLVAASVLSGAYAELFHEAVVQARTGIATGMLVGRVSAGSVLSLLAFSLGTFVILCILLNRRVFSAIIRWRFLIAAVVLTVCVACKLSGSSVALWGTVTGGTSFQGTLLGIPREIRSDEWDVMTPFSFSQVQSGFLAQSPILGGGGTDVTMVYGQPAFATATLFRPFLWGYFIFGAERGLSFYWCARLLCMLLVGFSFFRLFSKDDAICALGSLLCVLAPATQWWFAVNGTAELLIFGEGLVLVLARLLDEKKPTALWGWSALLSWLCYCYLFILYPAWQVPFFWIFLSLGVWVVLHWRAQNDTRERRMQLRSAIPATLVCLVALGVPFAWSLWSSRETIAAVMGSLYPGQRFETGGGLAELLPNLSVTFASPIYSSAVPNPCDAAAYAALAPLGLLLAVRNGCCKRRDTLVICLLVPYAVLLVYGFLGLPSPIARVLLLSNVPTHRLLLPLGFLDVALLVRGIALSESAAEKDSEVSSTQSAGTAIVCLLPAIILAVAYVMIGRLANPSALRAILCAVLFFTVLLLAAVITSMGLGEKTVPVNGRLALALATPLLLAGAFANPIQSGAQALLSNEPANLAEEVSTEQGTGTWVTDSHVLSQDLVAQGLPTINSVSTYPRVDLWEKIDPTGRYADCYNRYAHITVEPSSSTSFETVQADLITANLTADDLKALGVTYWLAFSSTDVSIADTPTTRLVLVASSGAYNVWRVESVQ